MRSLNNDINFFFSLAIFLSYGQEKYYFFQNRIGENPSSPIDGNFCWTYQDPVMTGWNYGSRRHPIIQVALKAALKKHWSIGGNFLHGHQPRDCHLKESLWSTKKIAKSWWHGTTLESLPHRESDFFTSEENQAFIEAANTISRQTQHPRLSRKPIRASALAINLPDTIKYSWPRFPILNLPLDISHWIGSYTNRCLQGKDGYWTRL